MRLLYSDSQGELRLTEDIRDPPPYAILSHRWTEDEVLFSDITSQSCRQKAGYAKLEFIADKAKEDGLEYYWVDTCCIDKSDTLELSKSITSMYSWYANAKMCYVYLADVTSDLLASDWFTRGWTLQELLAPQTVMFYNKHGSFLGSREELVETISSITRIETHALTGKSLELFTVEQRFAWASTRQTMEPEDIAYCLMGIFDVSMPPLYGEGRLKAFDRLKERISRKFDVDLMKLNVHNMAAIRLSSASSSTQALIEHTPPIVLLPRPQLPDSLRERRRQIINHLRFATMDARRATIKPALDRTCYWLLETPAFIRWKRHQASFLWIKAHPGAGKSTLMKFVDYQISEELEDSSDLLISFYFNARGNHLDQTINGIYRSLIVQLFEGIPQLQRVLDKLKFRRTTLPEPVFFEDAPTTVLREIMSAALAALSDRHVYCLIDALDEADEEDVLGMVDYLVHLEHNNLLSVCFASRHYPTLNFRVPLQIILDNDPGHRQDLKLYIDAKLQAGRDMQIRSDILSKANGIFMWVVLVVEILNKEYRRGSIIMVRRKLERLPSELVKLVQEIAQQGDIPNEHFFLCLQLILFARRPLTLPEFYFAMMAKMHDEPVDLTWNEDQITISDMQHFLITYSKGMAETTRAAAPKVQFIHESIRDFLLVEHGLADLLDANPSIVEPAAHASLARCCWNTFVYGNTNQWVSSTAATPEEASSAITKVPDREFPPKGALMKDSHWVPFFSYTIENIMPHFDRSKDDSLCYYFTNHFNYRDYRGWAVCAPSLAALGEYTFRDAQLRFKCEYLTRWSSPCYGQIDDLDDREDSKANGWLPVVIPEIPYILTDLSRGPFHGDFMIPLRGGRYIREEDDSSPGNSPERSPPRSRSSSKASSRSRFRRR